MKTMQILTNLAIVFRVLFLRFLLSLASHVTKLHSSALCRANICMRIRAKEERVFRRNVLNTKVNACKVLSYTYMCSNAFHYLFFYSWSATGVLDKK